MKKFEYYQKLCKRMIEDDAKRVQANRDYDRMDRNEWELPEQLRQLQWIRKVTSTDPHDVTDTGTRVLSSLDCRPTLQPLADNIESKQKANEIERVLSWCLAQANRRRQGKVEKHVVRSALKYDEVVCSVIDLEYQIKQKKIIEANTRREEAALNYGRFLVIDYHPSDVIVRYSKIMLEAVLLHQKRPAQEVLDEWGNKAAKLQRAADEDEWVIYYDYMDYEVHVVWCVPAEGGEAKESIIKILGPEEHKLPFLPWVARIGNEERRPILYSVRTAGQWDTQNIVKTLYTSEVIAHAAAPRLKEEGPISVHTTEVNYGDPTRKADVTPGNQLAPLPTPPIDAALAQIDDRLAQSISKSTVSQLLQGADVPSGTAFASLNLATQTAIGALKPAKELAEQALADIFTLMLLWVNFTGKDLYGYGRDKYGDMGKNYVVVADEIDPQGIYLNVELTPDVPLDRMQRANVAMMLTNSGIYPKERALEDMGVTDPQAAMEAVYFERMVDAMMAAHYQMMAQQLLMPQGPQPGMANLQNQMAGAPGGQAFNPEMGGLPPQMAAPGATREGVTGTDMTGLEQMTGMGGL